MSDSDFCPLCGVPLDDAPGRVTHGKCPVHGVIGRLRGDGGAVPEGLLGQETGEGLATRSDFGDALEFGGVLWRRVDELDVLHPETEEMRRFEVREPVDSYRSRQKLRYPDGTVLDDQGVAHEGGSAVFTLQGLTPGHDVLLVGRTDVMYVEGEIAVRVEGNPPIVFPDFAADRRYRWRNRAVPIPGEWIEGETLTVSVARVESTKDLSHFRYWVYQCERPVGPKDEASTDGPDAAAPVADDEEDDSLVDAPAVEVRVERQVVVETIRPSFLEEALRGDGLFPGGGPGAAGLGEGGGIGGGMGGGLGGGLGGPDLAELMRLADERIRVVEQPQPVSRPPEPARPVSRPPEPAQPVSAPQPRARADAGRSIEAALSPEASRRPTTSRPPAPVEPARPAEARPATPPATEITRVEAPAATVATVAEPAAAPAATTATPAEPAAARAPTAAGKAQRLVTITLRDDDARNGAVQDHLGAELADSWRIARVECVPHPTGGWLMVLLERDAR